MTFSGTISQFIFTRTTLVQFRKTREHYFGVQLQDSQYILMKTLNPAFSNTGEFEAGGAAKLVRVFFEIGDGWVLKGSSDAYDVNVMSEKHLLHHPQDTIMSSVWRTPCNVLDVFPLYIALVEGSVITTVPAESVHHTADTGSLIVQMLVRSHISANGTCQELHSLNKTHDGVNIQLAK